MKVAIPGRYTTANFLFSLYAPECRNKEEMNFSAIEEAVLSGEADAGVIIHENRFTYQQKGLFRVADLGEFWEEQTGKPIPLGGIAVKRSHSQEVKEKVDRVIRRSIEYAFSNPEAGRSFVRQHAQEMEEEVMYRHIELYVNKYSLELGKDGREAVRCLFRKAAELKVIPCPGEIFIN
jgi:1,4-dihydroxy-6-naphthoate synthase